MGRVRTRLEKNARKSAVRHETNRRSFPRGRPFRLVRRTRVPLMTARRECWFIRFSLPFSLPHNLDVSIFYPLFCMSVFFLPYPHSYSFLLRTSVGARPVNAHPLSEKPAWREDAPARRRRHLSVLPPPPLQHDIIRILRLCTVIMIAFSATSGKAQGVRKMTVQIGFFSKPLFVLHGPKKRNRVSLQNVFWAEIQRGYRHRARNTQYTITDTGGGPRVNLIRTRLRTCRTKSGN